MIEDRLYKDGMIEYMYDGELMKRGGRKRKGKKPSKAVQQQIVNVKVKVGDTVQLMKGKPSSHQMGMGDFRLLQGVGAKYANPPLVQQPASYGIYPASKAPMYDDAIKVGGGAQYNANKKDDIRADTNPWGIVPDKTPSKRAIAGKDMFADRRVNYETSSKIPMMSDDPSTLQVPDSTPSMRAAPSQPSSGYAAMRLPSQSLGDIMGIFERQKEEAQVAAQASSAAIMAEEKEQERELPLDRTGLPKVPGEKYSPGIVGFDYSGVPFKVNRSTGHKFYLITGKDKPQLDPKENAMRRGGRVHSGVF
jgi:hypothetical protein